MATSAVPKDHPLPIPTFAAIISENANLQEAAEATEAIFLGQLPSLEIWTDYCSEGMHARQARYNRQLVNVGYFNGSSWPYRRWAFAPLTSGQVPDMDGDKLCSWIDKNWLKDHIGNCCFCGPLTGTKYFPKRSGLDGDYAYSKDKNNREYVLIPANGSGTMIGYVPARTMQSLKDGYLIDPNNYKLVCDFVMGVHLACNEIEYQKHGFALHDKVWWPVKKGAYENYADEIEEEVAKMEGKVQEHLAHLPAPGLLIANVNGMQHAVQNLTIHAQHVEIRESSSPCTSAVNGAAGAAAAFVVTSILTNIFR